MKLPYSLCLSDGACAELGRSMAKIQVAAILNQPQSYLSKCESGEKRVDIIELYHFAKIYKKPIEYFVKGL